MDALDAFCDHLCQTPTAWPASARHLLKDVTNAYKRMYGRWDMCNETLQEFTIDQWKRGAPRSQAVLMRRMEGSFGRATKRARRAPLV